MSKVLYIQASPRADRSYSRAVADTFISAYAKAHPEDSVEVLDLFGADLPPFDGLAVQAKYRIFHGEQPSDEEKTAWKTVEAVIEKFKSADKYVFAIPMWNFGIPYRLKQYLDIIIQPGYTFSFSPESGYNGLLEGKTALTIYARGGVYSEGEGAALDFQKKYIDLVLGFVGINDVRSIVIEPTLAGGPDGANQTKETATAAAKKLALDF